MWPGAPRTSADFALYEAPVVMSDAVYPTGFEPRIESLLAEGRRDEVVALFFREVVRMPEDQLSRVPSAPGLAGTGRRCSHHPA